MGALKELNNTERDWLTSDRLTNFLRRGGYLPGGKVDAVVIRSIQKHHLQFEAKYSTNAIVTAPARLILKRYEAGYPHGENEGWFYQQIAPMMTDSPAPPCFGVEIGKDAGETHVLLADLSDTHFMPSFPYEQLSLDTFQSIAARFAQFHAFWWEHAKISQDGFIKSKGSSVAHAATAISTILENERFFAEGALPQWIKQYGTRFSKEWQALCRRAIAAWANLWVRRISDGKALTLIQGDAHMNNVLLPYHPPASQPVLIDWEGWIRGIGTWDLARMLIECRLADHKRYDLEKHLLPYYHSQLVRAGITGYSLPHCIDDYRLSVLANIPHALVWENFRYLQSAMQAFVDWKCEDLIYT